MLITRPPMGWNSWNTYGNDISEDLIKETADAMVESGLKDAGYEAKSFPWDDERIAACFEALTISW